MNIQSDLININDFFGVRVEKIIASKGGVSLTARFTPYTDEYIYILVSSEGTSSNVSEKHYYNITSAIKGFNDALLRHIGKSINAGGSVRIG